MRSRRTMTLCLAVAVAAFVLSLVAGPAAVQLVLTVVAMAAAAGFVVVWLARRQDPNGPPGQH